MALSQAVLGYGTRFLIAPDPDLPESYSEIDEITKIVCPAIQAAVIDATHMASPRRFREFISGMIDLGECSIDMNYVPSSATDDLILSILYQQSRQCKVVFPNTGDAIVEMRFYATVKSYEPVVPMDDKMSATLTMKVGGPLTRAKFVPAAAIMAGTGQVLPRISNTGHGAFASLSGSSSLEGRLPSLASSARASIPGTAGLSGRLSSELRAAATIRSDGTLFELPDDIELREDGGYELREDGGIEIR